MTANHHPRLNSSMRVKQDRDIRHISHPQQLNDHEDVEHTEERQGESQSKAAAAAIMRLFALAVHDGRTMQGPITFVDDNDHHKKCQRIHSESYYCQQQASS